MDVPSGAMHSMNNPSGSQRFARGQHVVHPLRPEWGTGIVRDTKPATHEGKPAQRLRVEFSNHGSLTLNSAIAKLEPIGPAPATPEPALAPRLASARKTSTKDDTMTMTQKKSWLDELEGDSPTEHRLWDLGPELTDPFKSAEEKLIATLKTYRFSTEPGPLFEWAVIQTGEDDPLSRHTRVELEQAFPRFARDREEHLRALVKQMKRANESGRLYAILSQIKHRGAKSALEKAMRG